METVTDFIFLGAKITADGEFSHEIKRRLSLGRKVMINLDSILKNRDYLANNGLSSQSYSFSRSHVCMWELDHKKRWVLKNLCFRTVVLEKTLESPLDLTNLKGNQHWSFTFSNSCWSWSFITLATWCEELTHWKGPWCWERLRAGGEGSDRGWDGWMASLTQWTWVWASSGS